MKITSMRTVLMRAFLRELGARGFSDHRIAEAAGIDPQILVRLKDFASRPDQEPELRFVHFAAGALVERREQAARAANQLRRPVSLARVSLQEAHP